jgi:hypothetical protein
VADLLWGHGRAMANLRVELHGLRRALRAFGIDAFPAGQDPLTLPQRIGLDEGRRAGEAMEGLDGLTGGFDTWLQYQRLAMSGAGEAGHIAFSEHVAELASEMRAPFVVFLEGLPFSGRASWARRLASCLAMPFLSGSDGDGSFVRYLDDDTEFDDSLARRIASDRSSVWVVARSAFGEDPHLMLRLRELIPAERMRYVLMPRLSWHQARTGPLADLSEDEASSLYLASGGLLGYLEELLQMRPAEGFGRDVPIPQRALARVKLEARRLSDEARLSVEKLSVHPFELSDTLIDELEVRPSLGELERHRWLRFEGGWSFGSEVVRKIVYAQVPPGRRVEVHRWLANHFEHRKRPRAARYHLLRSAPEMNEAKPAPSQPEGAGRERSDPERSIAAIGSMRQVEEPDEARGVVWSGQRAWLPAHPDQPRGYLRIDIPADVDALRVEGRLRWNGRYRDDHDSHLLDVKLCGDVSRTIALTPAAHAPVGDTGDLHVPAREDGVVDLWVRAEDFAFLEIRTEALDVVGSIAVAFVTLGRDESSSFLMTVPIYDLRGRELAEAR